VSNLSIDFERAKEIISKFPEKNILVIGDLILDKYLWGEVERISPEAPVPIVDVKEEILKLGGACNVAWNISKLDGKVYIAGVIGNDENGKILKNMLEEHNIKPLVIVDKTRPTTEKTRVLAVSQQLLRIDRENRKNISKDIIQNIILNIDSVIDKIDGIIVSDYGKGVITKEIMDYVISTGKPVFVDPKPENFHLYKNITIMTPNRKEAYKCVKKDRDYPLDKVGFEIMEKLNMKQLLITLGAEGMALFEDDKVVRIPAKARKVFDVTGAGDTVISVLTLSKVSGGSWLESAILSNLAGGYVVGEIGTVAITRDKLLSLV